MFGTTVDDEHSLSDWVTIVVHHLGLASFDGTPAAICVNGTRLAPADPERFRREMVRAAAVCVASIESLDRRLPPAPDALESLRRDARQLASDNREPVLLVTSHNPGIHREMSPWGPMAYAVMESLADAWERKNFAERIEPTGGTQ